MITVILIVVVIKVLIVRIIIVNIIVMILLKITTRIIRIMHLQGQRTLVGFSGLFGGA